MSVKLEHIYKTIGKQTILRDLSLEIHEGEIVGLLGPNGAGKSTLIKIIASIIQDYRGELRFSDSVRIGYVPQDISLEETVSAKDNLQFFGRLYGLSGKALKERISEVLREIGLEKREKDKVQTFSGGMKRRLNIGCAILHEPDLIIMDEPTVGIDPQSRQHIFQMVDRFREAGKTIIYASHYMEEIERLCDEAAFIDHGKIVENGTIQQILQKHAVPSIFVKGGNALPDKINEFGSVAAKNGGYIVQTNRPLDAMEFVLQFYKEKNDQLERLELVQPKLEDVFFSLTGKELRD